MLSDDCKAKIVRNRAKEVKHVAVRSDARAFVGDYVFGNVRSCEVVSEPLLQASYITSAALTVAGNSAKVLQE